MAQIGIADKTTLDAVKTKVDANLDAKVSAVKADTAQILAKNVFTKDFRTFSFYRSSTSSGTWYTALDITSGSGLLTAIYLFDREEKAELKVTIDGGTARTFISGTDFKRALRRTSSDSYEIMFYPFVKFNSSLKIELRHTHTGSISLGCDGDYGLF